MARFQALFAGIFLPNGSLTSVRRVQKEVGRSLSVFRCKGIYIDSTPPVAASAACSRDTLRRSLVSYRIGPN
jgi:hypothetical protein